uniref:Uncharacterized protein n=1 Tax=Romanomermis culicivorax TaxID=13658 RepID=A0A915HWN2_ROMCU
MLRSLPGGASNVAALANVGADHHHHGLSYAQIHAKQFPFQIFIMNVTKAPKSPLARKSVDFILGRRSPVSQNFVSSHQIAHCPPSPSTAKSQAPIELEVVLLGASKVGKTAIARQFLWHQFTGTYKETIEDFNWIEYECENSGAEPADQHHSSTHPQTFMLKLIDTSGSHEFLAMRDLCIKKAHAFILVHSVDLPQSFDEAKRLRHLIDELNVKNAQVILVTNKVDLLPETTPCSSSALNVDCTTSRTERVAINRIEIGEFAMLNNCIGCILYMAGCRCIGRWPIADTSATEPYHSYQIRQQRK